MFLQDGGDAKNISNKVSVPRLLPSGWTLLYADPPANCSRVARHVASGQHGDWVLWWLGSMVVGAIVAGQCDGLGSVVVRCWGGWAL